MNCALPIAILRSSCHIVVYGRTHLLKDLGGHLAFALNHTHTGLLQVKASHLTLTIFGLPLHTKVGKASLVPLQEGQLSLYSLGKAICFSCLAYAAPLTIRSYFTSLVLLCVLASTLIVPIPLSLPRAQRSLGSKS